MKCNTCEKEITDEDEKKIEKLIESVDSKTSERLFEALQVNSNTRADVGTCAKCLVEIVMCEINDEIREVHEKLGNVSTSYKVCEVKDDNLTDASMIGKDGYMVDIDDKGDAYMYKEEEEE